MVDKKKTPIQKFYRGKVIFLTGATGYIGKLIIERLFSTCSDIEKIYILIRNKRGKSIGERLNLFLEDPLFSKLTGDWRDKVIPIDGELGKADMNLSQENRLILTDNTNVVFHSAATVRFDEKLEIALKVNVVGTADVISLCKEMKNLESFVYISTAFADCVHGQHIEERLSKPNIFFDDILETAKCSDGNALEILKPKILGFWPNSYTFSKAVAEYIISKETESLPVACFKPGIVLGTSGKHPVCGYIDSIFGISGLLVGVGLGVVRILNAVSEIKMNSVPGDYCANGILTSAWYVAQERPKEPLVVLYVPNQEDNICWGDMVRQWSKCGKYMPTSMALWWPNVEITSSIVTYNTKRIFVHFIPAVILDFLAKRTGREPKLMMVHRKIEKFFDSVRNIMWKDWTFQLDGMTLIRTKMIPEDRELFYTDMTNFDWKAYAPTVVHGVRCYLLKESPKTLPVARKRFKKLKYIHFAVLYGLLILILGIFWVLSSFIL